MRPQAATLDSHREASGDSREACDSREFANRLAPSKFWDFLANFHLRGFLAGQKDSCSLGSEESLTNFRAPFFKEIPSFFCGVTPSKTLTAPQPLNIAFPLGNGGVLRSEEGGGIEEGRGRWGGGKKKEKRTRKKCCEIAHKSLTPRHPTRRLSPPPDSQWQKIMLTLYGEMITKIIR